MVGRGKSVRPCRGDEFQLSFGFVVEGATCAGLSQGRRPASVPSVSLCHSDRRGQARETQGPGGLWRPRVLGRMAKH